MDAWVEEMRRRFEAAWARMPKQARRLPAKEAEHDPEDGGVPVEMQLGSVNGDGWVDWQLRAPRVSAADVEALERRFGRLPPALHGYLRACCHLFEEIPFGEDSVMLPAVPTDDPLGPTRRVLESWPPLEAAGYLAVADYGCGAGPICIDRMQPTGAGDFAVVWLDHDALFALDDHELLERAKVAPLARPLAPSMAAFLRRCFPEAPS